MIALRVSSVRACCRVAPCCAISMRGAGVVSRLGIGAAGVALVSTRQPLRLDIALRLGTLVLSLDIALPTERV